MELPIVLIVDDREFDRILYKEFIGDDNYQFSELDDGEGIIDQLKNEIPDIILLDWQMPRVNGLETLKLIKKNKAFDEIPIIIITGLKDEEVLEKAFDYGGIDFLNKPVSKIELNSRVMNALKLSETKRILIQQKRELLELNQIIKNQKSELEKSLALKNQLLETTEEEFKKGIQSQNKKVLTMELDANKIVNNFKSIKNTVDECYSTLKTELPESPVIRKLKQISRTLEGMTVSDDSWDEFKEAFKTIDNEFFDKLSKMNPKLTTLDLKHCAYIKMNLDNYEVSKILNVELKSLQMTRYRLKKKLKLEEGRALREFILTI